MSMAYVTLLVKVERFYDCEDNRNQTVFSQQSQHEVRNGSIWNTAHTSCNNTLTGLACASTGGVTVRSTGGLTTSRYKIHPSFVVPATIASAVSRGAVNELLLTADRNRSNFIIDYVMKKWYEIKETSLPEEHIFPGFETGTEFNGCGGGEGPATAALTLIFHGVHAFMSTQIHL